MAVKKPRSKRTIDREAANTARKREPQSDGRKPVYVLISEKARGILERAAKPPRTQATVIEALLENYENEESGIKERILDRQNIRALKEHGDLLELRSWAEHAFLNKRYVWAAGMYTKLANHPSSSEGLKNICNYRLSLCFIRLSYDVRAEALKNGIDKDAFHLALEALDKAIDYTGRVDRAIGPGFLLPKLVLYYNLASCYSLKARYLVESELDPESSLTQKVQEAGKNVTDNVWKGVGETWRRSQEERKIDKERNVDSEARNALIELRKIFPLPSQGETFVDSDYAGDSDLSSERIWLVESTLTDEDFTFLRLDKQKFQSEYEAWKSPALEDRQPTADAVRALLQR